MLTSFVTGSGTEIGKTFVTCGLARSFRDAGRAVAVLKPIMSGVDPADLDASDAALMLEAAGTRATSGSVAAIAPWRFEAPISPDMAASRVGIEIDFAALLQFCRHARQAASDVLLIEGVGGVMAPIGPRRTVLDWIEALGHPAILVSGTHLGAISHALTAALALRSRGIPITALVLSESTVNPVPAAETRAVLSRHLPDTFTALVRRGPAASADLASLAASLGGG